MAFTYTPKKILDLKVWEKVTGPPFTVNGSFQSAYVNHIEQKGLGIAGTGANTVFIYNVEEDAWVGLPNSGATGTHFGAGTSAVGHAWSTGSTVGVFSLTATGGTTSTINTNQTLARGLSGYLVQILSGPNAGSTLTIRSNTTGANSVITVDVQPSAFTASTVYRLCVPRFYIFYGTTAGVSFRSYDIATNTWQTLSTTGVPSTFGTDAALVSTPSWNGSNYHSFATGTATSATGTTLVNSAKAWTTNQWTNYQIRITGGTGAGQIRTITANDATSVTVATWTTTPDSTSTYSIEGNDDFLYMTGNNSTAFYRYQISTNTWTTLTARPASSSTGCTSSWVFESLNSAWTNESAIINGRRIYSMRGGSTSTIHVYDIPSNSWSTLVYSPESEVFSSGGGISRYALIRDQLYAQSGTSSSSFPQRIMRLDLVNNELSGWASHIYIPGNSGAGNFAWPVRYTEGTTEINWMYLVPLSSAILIRRRVI